MAAAVPIPKNTAEFTLGEIARAVDGTVSGPEALAIRGVSIDTRTIDPGAVFVALKGADSDGHSYLAAAAERGAVAALVEHGRGNPALPRVDVEDTLVALGRLAHYHVERIRAIHPVISIAIGGAAGKTTTKEITAALARAAFGRTLSTIANFNNLIGVPMMLLMLTEEHQAMVIECGTNTRGEIPRLSAIVEPDVAMVLNVDIEHSEGLGTLAEIADEEAALFAHARRAVVIPNKDPMLVPRVPRGVATVTFGTSDDSNVQLAERSITSHGRAWIYVELDRPLVAHGVDPVIRKEIPLVGAAAALNCTAAIAAIAAAAPVPLDFGQLRAIEHALAGLVAVPGRLATREIGTILVIDDTYNANPRSVRVALEAAREIADGIGARLLIALGDMLELGEFSASAHADAIEQVVKVKPAAFVAIGPQIGAAANAVTRTVAAEVRLCTDSAEAARVVRQLVRPGDVLLVKGSRGIRTERVLEALS